MRRVPWVPVVSAEHDEEKAQAESIAQKIEGVQSVRNLLKDITVKVKNGVVRLTGIVPTGTRRLEAAVLARSIQGVRAVEDDLRIASA